VVQVTAGFSALALALIAGRRGERSGAGHAPALSLAGGALLWVGWSGIVGGWALGATDDAATAILNLHFAACAGMFCWAMLDQLLTGRVSATGLLSGAIAGLAAISASAGLVGAGGAMLIGLMAAFICRCVSAAVRGLIDDPAGVFALHGVGGLLGVMLLAPFTLPLLGGVGFDPSVNLVTLLVSQSIGLGAVALWAMIGSSIIALTVSLIAPLRAAQADEEDGLDAAQHGQQSWDFR
jgi:Amt family ammonium transporter